MWHWLSLRVAVGITLICGCWAVHADPPLKGKWTVLPELSDEFRGGTLDDHKWLDNNPTWAGREPGYFARANVSVRNDMLLLKARAEDLPHLPTGYHSYTTAAVQSRVLVKYGYFEIRCKAMNSKVSSAFWFTNHTPDEWTEIDVFEIGGGVERFERSVFMNAHLFKNEHYSGTGAHHIQDSYRWIAPFRPKDDFHVYALEWSRDLLKWYVDGRVVRVVKNTYWHQPLTMNFDSETMPNWFGLPNENELPATYYIDYVRSWASEETEVTLNR